MSSTAPASSAREHLRERIEARTATVGVVGLGYVGLPVAHAMHRAGFPVIGFDVDGQKIQMLERGESYLKHLGEQLVGDLASSDRFEASSDPASLGRADAVLVCVPTPLGRNRDPDLSFVERSTHMLAGVLHKGMLVSLESTTYPGTTRDVVLPILEETGLQCGKDFFLAFSPEREDPGRAGFETSTIPRLVGGIDDASGELAELLYSAAIEHVVRVDSAEVAEAAKLLENIYRAVNIALVNELKPVLDRMDIDVWKVIEAASTKPFGFQAFFPGPGLGGHCIPIDPFYLTWKARELGLETRFIELAGEVNNAMPRYVIDRLARALNDDGKAVKGSRVLVVGLAYKPDVDDTRETPAAEIITLLSELGAQVSYHDPHVPVFPEMRKYSFDMASVPLTREGLEQTDCVLVVTHHKAVNWQLIADAAPLVVDSRNAMAGTQASRARIVKA